MARGSIRSFCASRHSLEAQIQAANAAAMIAIAISILDAREELFDAPIPTTPPDAPLRALSVVVAELMSQALYPGNSGNSLN